MKNCNTCNHMDHSDQISVTEYTHIDSKKCIDNLKKVNNKLSVRLGKYMNIIRSAFNTDPEFKSILEPVKSDLEFLDKTRVNPRKHDGEY